MLKFMTLPWFCFEEAVEKSSSLSLIPVGNKPVYHLLVSRLVINTPELVN